MTCLPRVPERLGEIVRTDIAGIEAVDAQDLAEILDAIRIFQLSDRQHLVVPRTYVVASRDRPVSIYAAGPHSTLADWRILGPLDQPSLIGRGAGMGLHHAQDPCLDVRKHRVGRVDTKSRDRGQPDRITCAHKVLEKGRREPAVLAVKYDEVEPTQREELG